MITCSKYIVFILGFFLLIRYPLTSMEQSTPTISTQQKEFWASSVNFTFRNKVAIDSQAELNSDKLLVWHLSQAPVLADIYSNYQENAGRNVAKALISIVYSNEEGQTYIAHYPLNHIFINGWHLQDNFVYENASKRMILDPSSKGTTKIQDIQSLYGILSTSGNLSTYLQQLIDNQLITGFSNSSNLLTQTSKYRNPNFFQPPFIRDLKEKQTHSEKLILIKIDMDIENILDKMNIPRKSNINYFIINIASYRYMCPGCKEIGHKDSPQFNLLMKIKNKVNEFFDQKINIKVLYSGIAAGQDDNIPNYLNCRTPIKIEEEPDRILYLIQNPLRPFTYKDYSSGDFKTTLVLNSNYLAYQGNKW